MSGFETLFSALQTLFAALECSKLKQLYSSFNYKKEFEDLQRTIGNIKAVLEDVESKQVEVKLSRQVQLWIEELKDVVYDADDLVDELVTLAEQKKRKHPEGYLFEKVKSLFSIFSSTVSAWKKSNEIKEIREKLDRISRDHNKFRFKLDCQRIRKRREETCSYVDEQEIIGREEDLEKIVAQLLDPNVSCLSIVGIGGLGKTALAQLVYNHPRIKEAFQDYRWWTCVSDDGGWELKVVLSKILESIKEEKDTSHPSMQLLQNELLNRLDEKKYLLFLDDVWTEDRAKWDQLMRFFKGSLVGGSSILVTTRSKMTATIVGGEIHELKGLSDEDSWSLFEKTAFAKDHEAPNRSELDQIGREIVKKCSNVPLAIRVVGTALYAQDERVWLSFRDLALVRIKGEEGIEPILKLSYLNLHPPQLKICFSYCALFPKDYVIKKERLIQLWIAQGYVVPLHVKQNIEDVAEEYFLTLLRRCFFQDIERSSTGGEIESFKMHDLMHDIAQEAAGMEIPKYSSLSSSLDDKTRHLMHLDEGSGTKGLFKGTKIRTYLDVGQSRPESPEALDSLLDSWISLRALDLSCSDMRSLPSTIGKLLHLRYLDLSFNDELEVLPNSITKLHNLQFLDVYGCQNLKHLPKDLGKLTNLRVLNTQDCNSLTHMPTGIGKLSFIWKLPYFVVGEGTSGKQRGQLAHRVEELKALQNLKGSIVISIKIPPKGKYVMGSGGEKVRLSQHLTDICITFRWRELDDDDVEEALLDDDDVEEALLDDDDVRIVNCEVEEALLDDLQPHSNLREFKLDRYSGRRMPNWKMFFPKLVSIKLSNCSKLKHIGELRELRALKSLELHFLDDLEYMWNSMSMISSGAGALESDPSFFPSLETVELSFLPKLKGWWREESSSNQIDDDGLIYPSLPCLSQLDVENCPNFEIDEALLDDLQPHPNLREFELERYSGRRMPNWAMFFPKLVSINLSWGSKLKHIGELRELRALKSLELRSLDDLEYIWNTRVSRSMTSSGAGALESDPSFFPSLETVKLRRLPKLKGWWREESSSSQIDDDGLIYPSLPCLSKLVVEDCPNFESMPPCPSVEVLYLRDYNLRLLDNIQFGNSKLRRVETDNVGHLKLAMRKENFQCLSELLIKGDQEVETLSEVEEMFRGCSSSLQVLAISECSKLKSVRGGLEHLTALEELLLEDLPNLSLSKEGEGEEDTDDDDDGMPWRSLEHSLRSLDLRNLPKLVKLPNGMRHLTALQSLSIWSCKNLEAIPEWMPELTSLKHLCIFFCSDTLIERCRKDTGEDWPNIQHIPRLDV